MSDNKYELVFCVVNAGFSGEVMEAARATGATGGTVLHARGTANPQAEKKFNITVQPDKDAVLLVVSAEVKDAVLKAIYDKTGTDTNGNGIAFSLPVTDAVGLRKTEEKKA